MENAVRLCHDCYAKEEEFERVVAEFVRDNPRSSVELICKNTGVKEKVVLRMIRAGRFVNDAEISYPCESCGKPIYRGKRCDECNNDFIKQAQSVTKQYKNLDKETGETEAAGRGMYTKHMLKG